MLGELRPPQGCLSVSVVSGVPTLLLELPTTPEPCVSAAVTSQDTWA